MSVKYNKVLLAVEADLDKVTYPKLAMPKLDGVRATIQGGVVLSRTLKPIPNKFVQDTFGRWSELEGLDGELIIGPPNAPDVYNKTVSGVMTIEGSPDVQFYVFDDMQGGIPWNKEDKNFIGYKKRIDSLDSCPEAGLHIVPYDVVNSREEVEELLEKYLDLGYEGVMLRDPNGKYKTGRSTLKEQILLKVKKFKDFEARIVGAYEMMHNNNEAFVNELGATARSSHKENKVASGMLGGITCEADGYEEHFDVGTGFNFEQRRALWEEWTTNPEEFKKKIPKIKSQPSGEKDKPRFPVFIGWRDEIDL